MLSVRARTRLENAILGEGVAQAAAFAVCVEHLIVQRLEYVFQHSLVVAVAFRNHAAFP